MKILNSNRFWIALAASMYFALFLASCRKPASKSSTEKVDSTYYKETVRIDTVFQPGEIVPFEIPCPKDKNSLQKSFTFKGKKATVRAAVGSDNVVRGVADCPDLRALVASRDKEIFRLKSEKKDTVSVIEKYETSWYDKVCRSIAGITVLYILIQILKRKLFT